MSGEEEVIYNLFIDPEELKGSLEEVILSWSCRSVEIGQSFQIIVFNHRRQGEILFFSSRAFKLVKDGLDKT